MIFTRVSVVVALAACVVAVIYAVIVETQGQDVPTAYYPEHEEALLKTEREAITAAYRQQVQNLYLVWMKDPKDQPERAHRGVNMAKEAYVHSMDAIAKREEAMKQMIVRP